MHNFINITGEIFIWKCTAACSHHLHSTLELRNTWKIKFQKRGSKIPTLLLCCYSQTKGRSPKPLASPHGLSAARKNTEKSWVSNEGNCRAGGSWGWHRLTPWPLCGLCCAYVSSTHRSGKGGRGGDRGQPNSELGAQQHFQPCTDLLPWEKLRGFQGRWSLGMDLGSL